MSKTSFGKLAIGVVALSSSVLVHAGVRDTLAGTQAGLDVDPIAMTVAKKELRLPTDLVAGRFHFASPSLLSAYGPVSLQIAGGVGYLNGGESLHKIAPTMNEGEAATVPTQKIAEQMEAALSRSASQISGVAGSAGLKFGYAINSSAKVVAGVEGGLLLPVSNASNYCPLVSGSFGGQYLFNASHAMEAKVKVTHFADKVIKDVASFNVAWNYTI